jgi:hypothetical protein
LGQAQQQPFPQLRIQELVGNLSRIFATFESISTPEVGREVTLMRWTIPLTAAPALPVTNIETRIALANQAPPTARVILPLPPQLGHGDSDGDCNAPPFKVSITSR